MTQLPAREDFPILAQKVNGKPLAYLDSASTTQKPRVVLEALERYYEEDNSNVHRGVHALSQRATEAFEGAREKVQRFLSAREAREVVFVRGTTEGINLVAQSWGRANVRKGDEVILTQMEHHSNIVPWQLLCEQAGARLRVVPVSDSGELELGEYEKLLNRKTKLVALTHVSNALGTINPVREMAKRAHEAGALVLVDGAQAVPHLPVDVRELDCDFYAFSGHKVYGPTGIGALYGRAELLEGMPPWQGGGDMIKSVTFERTLYNDVPHKFEAGTPHIAGAVGLGAALEYVQKLGIDKISAHEKGLLSHATNKLAELPGVRLVGTAREKAAVQSFVVEGVHPHDVGTLVDREGVAIRTGHHCTQPLMERFGVPATCRASFALYNTREEADRLADAVQKVREVFTR